MAKSLMIAFIFLFIGSFALPIQSEANQTAKVQNMNKIKFTIGKNIAHATLYDSPVSRDFLAQLPLTLTFKDFASKEKIAYPPKKLSAGEGTNTPSEGDLAYYAPWGNVAVFYKDNATATGDLLILGRFDSGKEFFNISESFKALIEVDP